MGRIARVVSIGNALGWVVSLGFGCAASENPDQATSAVNGGGDAALYSDSGWTGLSGGGDAGYAPGSGGTGPDQPGLTGLTVPPEVCTVLQKNACMSCHSTPQAGGAPMPLQTKDHFAGTAKDGSSLAQKVLARMQDATAPMPPKSTGKGLPAAADVEVLKSWMAGGMQGVQGAPCVESARPITDIGPDEIPDWSSRGWPEGECDYVITLGAHGDRTKAFKDDPTPYPIPAGPTHYECFWQQVPEWDGPVQAIGMRARIETPEDKELVHHFVVSGVEPWNVSVAGARPDLGLPGDHKPCDNPNGQTMGIWAPGGLNPLSYPQDVGVKLPGPGSFIELQIHYNNPLLKAGRGSRAQYDICVTKKPRPQTAGVFWLGYENTGWETLAFGGNVTSPLDNKGNGVAMGSCAAKAKGRILSIMPHMHERGIHAKLEVVRKDGTVQTAMDDAFDFQDQRSYFRQNLWVEPGDTVRTTCKWKQPGVHFGFASADEMCFFYTLAYPLEVFKAGPTEKGFAGGDLACAGGLGWLGP